MLVKITILPLAAMPSSPSPSPPTLATVISAHGTDIIAIVTISIFVSTVSCDNDPSCSLQHHHLHNAAVVIVAMSFLGILLGTLVGVDPGVYYSVGGHRPVAVLHQHGNLCGDLGGGRPPAAGNLPPPRMTHSPSHHVVHVAPA